MAEKNYTFDPDSLTYQKNEKKKKGRRIFFSIIAQISIAVFIAVLVFFAITSAITNPKEKKLAEENRFMDKEYKLLEEKYKQAYEVLEELKKRDRQIYSSVYETELPVDDEYKKKYEFFEKEKTDKQLFEILSQSQNTSDKKLDEEEKLYSELKVSLLGYNGNLAEIPNIQPVSDPKVTNVYYGYGQKLDPIYKTPQMHSGIDIATSVGTDVFATADGTVEYVGELIEYGKHIVINHKNGYKTIYAHLSEYAVKINQKVKCGETIGFVGNTGKSLTPHLHYEVSFNGKNVNPVPYFFASLAPKEYCKLKKMANDCGLCLD